MESVDADREGPGAGLPQICQIVLKGGSLVGQSLGEARMRERFGVTVVRVTRAIGEEGLNPTADTVLREGDRLRLFGLPRQIDALLQPGQHPSLGWARYPSSAMPRVTLVGVLPSA